MKYRVRLDLSFEKEADGRALMDYAEGLMGKASNMNEGAANQEISFADLEICRHDEGLPCIKLARAELKRLADKTVEPLPAPEPPAAPPIDVFADLETYMENGYHVLNLGGTVVRRKNPATAALVLCSRLGLGTTREEVIPALKELRETPNRNLLLEILEGKK